jgi:hypothetical protein
MKLISLAVRATALIALALVFAHVGLSGTAAQYPPPTGNIIMGASNATPTAGTSVSVSATVVNHTGTAMPDLSCTFQVLSQPGTDATVDAGPKTTDANGVATSTLNVGSTAGTIVVGVTCGELESQVAVVAGAAVAPAEPGAPAAAALPPTGFAPVARTLPAGALMALLCTGLLALSAGSTLCLVSSRIKGDS